MISFRYKLTIILFSMWASTQGQTVYDVEAPLNVSCETALPICDDIVYNVLNSSETICLFFKFQLQESENINLSAWSTYGALSVRGPLTPDNPCLDVSCVINPSGGWNNESLPAGIYYIYYSGPGTTTIDINLIEGQLCPPPTPCEGCLPPFSPLPEQAYLLNAWVKQENMPLGTTHYSEPKIVVEAPLSNPIGVFSPSGPIIDGWQRIEGSFIMPATPSSFKVSLETLSGSALFDDIRIFPADGSMKCYVYDPVTLRFVAELDERHFATIYEYDNEGRLVRVKKETERGIKTLKESRENTHHRP